MYQAKEKKRKEVHVTFDYHDISDLNAILIDLREKLCQGIETYHSEIKAREIENKWQKLQFQQMYVNSERESVEREINGNITFVIKSKI